MVKGKIYVASKNMRGNWAAPTDVNSIKVDATSAQGKTSKNRRDFSPMTEIIGGYKGFWCFENYWQSLKVFDGIPEDDVKNWWASLKEPKRRYPNSKGLTVLHAKFAGDTEKMDYITSRKKVYVPEYYNLIKDREMTQYWADMLNNGHNITIYDFDGPRKSNGDPDCIEIHEDGRELIEKINDTKYPFGHCYVVASLIAGIDLQKYVF